MFDSAVSTIKNHLKNIPGWRTSRKIVVFESDDWGSIRMPSRRVYKQCLKAGYQVNKIAYERYDSLASEGDLEFLFELLDNYKDKNGNSAVITANILTANPNFKKIKSSGFKEYSYELVTKTFERYPQHSGCLNLWKKGKERGIFYPQCHGREHLNVSMFMNALQKGNKDAHFGLEHNMPGSMPNGKTVEGSKFVESLRYTNQQDKDEKLSIILEGLELFEKLMGYKSETFIPPNYLWSPDYNEAVSNAGVQIYQGQRKMREPRFDGTVRLHTHRLGEQNKYGQRYLIRNAFFEPALLKQRSDPVGRCLKAVAAAFRMNKPAIISSHRLNYVGFIDEKNRDRNLKMLDRLLNELKKQWPDVEFLTSVELGNLITADDGKFL